MPKRRSGKILLLPLLILAFLVGWILYMIGEPDADRPRVSQRRTKTQRKLVEFDQKDPVEMGLVAEIEEEQAKVK